MDKPIRVLQVFASLDRGGAETMIMNVYRAIDKKRVQFDFIVNESTNKYAYEDEIINLGGKILKIPRYTISNYFKYKQSWIQLLNVHPEWEIIHGHHTTPASIYLKQGKLYGRCTIAHSHTAGGESTIKSKVKIHLRRSMLGSADYLFACSKSAADWMFGEENAKVKLINNAISAELFKYNTSTRAQIRKEFKIKEDTLVVGHVGNFSDAKNYPLILEIFKEIQKYNNMALLILIGKNENDPGVQKRVFESGLENNVIFTGVRSDIYNLLQGLDVFLFPSVTEGLPVTLIEAQASGLKIVASDVITKEVAITGNIEFISLAESPRYWAERVLSYQNGYERKDTSEEIINAGYDVKENAKWLEDFYIEQYTNINEKYTNY